MKVGFVVEGFNDEYKVKEVIPNALCVVTKGTRMNGRVKMDMNEALNLCDEVFLLTDPDEAGETLAEMVLKLYPNLTRIKLDRKQCLCYRNHKVKVGVEHCENDYLKNVLEQHIKEY